MSGLINLMQLWANGLATLVRGEIYKHAVFLTTPLTSTSWDGDSHSTTAKTLIDLSAVFGVPEGAKAVLAHVAARDSASSTTTCHFSLAPNDTDGQYCLVCKPYQTANDSYVHKTEIVPCNANGDIYYQCAATGAETLDVLLEIWGYYI